MDEPIIAAFAAVLSEPGTVITDGTTLTESGRDYWGFGGEPGLLLRPRTRDEVVAIVQLAAAHHVSLATRGGVSNCSAGVMISPHRPRPSNSFGLSSLLPRRPDPSTSSATHPAVPSPAPPPGYGSPHVTHRHAG
jgi:hypothetical protein